MGDAGSRAPAPSVAGITSIDMPSCSICLGEYAPGIRKPWDLGCGHCICGRCYASLSVSGPKTCPVDRTDWNNPHPSYELLHLVEQLRRCRGDATNRSDVDDAPGFPTLLGGSQRSGGNLRWRIPDPFRPTAEALLILSDLWRAVLWPSSTSPHPNGTSASAPASASASAGLGGGTAGPAAPGGGNFIFGGLDDEEPRMGLREAAGHLVAALPPWVHTAGGILGPGLGVLLAHYCWRYIATVLLLLLPMALGCMAATAPHGRTWPGTFACLAAGALGSASSISPLYQAGLLQHTLAAILLFIPLASILHARVCHCGFTVIGRRPELVGLMLASSGAMFWAGLQPPLRLAFFQTCLRLSLQIGTALRLQWLQAVLIGAVEGVLEAVGMEWTQEALGGSLEGVMGMEVGALASGLAADGALSSQPVASQLGMWRMLFILLRGIITPVAAFLAVALFDDYRKSLPMGGASTPLAYPNHAPNSIRDSPATFGASSSRATTTFGADPNGAAPSGSAAPAAAGSWLSSPLGARSRAGLAFVNGGVPGSSWPAVGGSPPATRYDVDWLLLRASVFLGVLCCTGSLGRASTANVALHGASHLIRMVALNRRVLRLFRQESATATAVATTAASMAATRRRRLRATAAPRGTAALAAAAGAEAEQPPQTRARSGDTAAQGRRGLARVTALRDLQILPVVVPPAGSTGSVRAPTAAAAGPAAAAAVAPIGAVPPVLAARAASLEREAAAAGLPNQAIAGAGPERDAAPLPPLLPLPPSPTHVAESRERRGVVGLHCRLVEGEREATGQARSQEITAAAPAYEALPAQASPVTHGASLTHGSADMTVTDPAASEQEGDAPRRVTEDDALATAAAAEEENGKENGEENGEEDGKENGEENGKENGEENGAAAEGCGSSIGLAAPDTDEGQDESTATSAAAAAPADAAAPREDSNREVAGLVEEPVTPTGAAVAGPGAELASATAVTAEEAPKAAESTGSKAEARGSGSCGGGSHPDSSGGGVPSPGGVSSSGSGGIGRYRLPAGGAGSTGAATAATWSNMGRMGNVGSGGGGRRSSTSGDGNTATSPFRGTVSSGGGNAGSSGGLSAGGSGGVGRYRQQSATAVTSNLTAATERSRRVPETATVATAVSSAASPSINATTTAAASASAPAASASGGDGEPPRPAPPRAAAAAARDLLAPAAARVRLHSGSRAARAGGVGTRAAGGGGAAAAPTTLPPRGGLYDSVVWAGTAVVLAQWVTSMPPWSWLTGRLGGLFVRLEMERVVSWTSVVAFAGMAFQLVNVVAAGRIEGALRPCATESSAAAAGGSITRPSTGANGASGWFDVMTWVRYNVGLAAVPMVFRWLRSLWRPLAFIQLQLATNVELAVRLTSAILQAADLSCRVPLAGPPPAAGLGPFIFRTPGAPWASPRVVQDFNALIAGGTNPRRLLSAASIVSFGVASFGLGLDFPLSEWLSKRLYMALARMTGMRRRVVVPRPAAATRAATTGNAARSDADAAMMALQELSRISMACQAQLSRLSNVDVASAATAAVDAANAVASGRGGSASARRGGSSGGGGSGAAAVLQARAPGRVPATAAIAGGPAGLLGAPRQAAPPPPQPTPQVEDEQQRLHPSIVGRVWDTSSSSGEAEAHGEGRAGGLAPAGGAGAAGHAAGGAVGIRRRWVKPAVRRPAVVPEPASPTAAAASASAGVGASAAPAEPPPAAAPAAGGSGEARPVMVPLAAAAAALAGVAPAGREGPSSRQREELHPSLAGPVWDTSSEDEGGKDREAASDAAAGSPLPAERVGDLMLAPGGSVSAGVAAAVPFARARTQPQPRQEAHLLHPSIAGPVWDTSSDDEDEAKEQGLASEEASAPVPSVVVPSAPTPVQPPARQEEELHPSIARPVWDTSSDDDEYAERLEANVEMPPLSTASAAAVAAAAMTLLNAAAAAAPSPSGVGSGSGSDDDDEASDSGAAAAAGGSHPTEEPNPRTELHSSLADPVWDMASSSDEEFYLTGGSYRK